MKYRIEIWQYHSMTEEYESDNIEGILEWYRAYWQYCYDCGGCSFNVYKNGERLDFDEEYKLGFHN